MKKVHFIGICGTGMGSLAGLFRAAGWDVRGSDRAIYPPMSQLLADLDIPVMEGFSPAHLDWSPTLVVVGNIARPDNPEATEARRRGLPCTSMAAALEDHFLVDRHVVVVAGTHGKTTTTALLAWALEGAGRDPGYLIGGVPAHAGGRSFRLGGGDLFVIEGDEYETAFFDKGPKFLHYRPRTAILTSIELDHVEVFEDLAALETAFRQFVALLPADGRLIACTDDDRVVAVTRTAVAPVVSYGLGGTAAVRGVTLEVGRDGMTFEIHRRDEPAQRLHSPLTGDHNLRNLVATAECLRGLGLTDTEIAAGLASFPGVRRRQEIRGEIGEVTIMEDFAHHPTAVRETLHGVRLRFRGRRLVAVFEPRTNSSRRSLFQEAYAAAFDDADAAIIAAVDQPQRAPADDRLDPYRLAADVTRRGTPATHLPTVSEILGHLTTTVTAGDVVLVLSNGAFGGLLDNLLAALQSRLDQGADGASTAAASDASPTR